MVLYSGKGLFRLLMGYSTQKMQIVSLIKALFVFKTQ